MQRVALACPVKSGLAVVLGLPDTAGAEVMSPFWGATFPGQCSAPTSLFPASTNRGTHNEDVSAQPHQEGTALGPLPGHRG
jgi:hypothetical protein